MKVVFKKDCIFNNKYYFVDDELEVTKENVKDVWKLNEKGFIAPITIKEYKLAERELYKPVSKTTYKED